MADPVHDFFPRGTPLIVSDQMEAAMLTALENGATVKEAHDRLEEEQVKQLRNDTEYRQTLRDAFNEAGVNLVNTTMMSFSGESYAGRVHDDLLRWTARFDAVDWLHKVTSPAEAYEVANRGDIGIILNTQNLGATIEGNADAVEGLYNAGIRCTQLTYNSQNFVGIGCTERIDAGLSHHGVDVIQKLNNLGVIVDLSHCGRATTLDAIEVSESPVAFTHVFCEALAEHDRAKSDAELEALAEVDGYAGIVAVPFFLEPDTDTPSFETFFDHIDHVVSILGVDRVGIGTDWGSWTPEIPDALHEGFLKAFEEMGFREEHGVTIGEGYGPMQRYEDWGVIKDGLKRRGYKDEELRGILGENFLSFWERVLS
jgi:membrane dipeptidase